MSGVAVVTAIFSDYEVPKPPLPQLDADGAPLEVDWVMVTDDPSLGDVPVIARHQGWRVISERRPKFIHPNRAAKRPKLLPWNYTNAQASVWIDGSYRVTSPRFVAEALALADPIAQFPHPWRDCLYDEAEFSTGLAKYANEPLKAQAATYRALGHPEHWGLWAAGVIARRHTPEVRKMGELWQANIGNWSFQDQVSEPYVLRTCGLRPASLPGNHLDNPWLSYEGSARH